MNLNMQGTYNYSIILLDIPVKLYELKHILINIF